MSLYDDIEIPPLKRRLEDEAPPVTKAREPVNHASEPEQSGQQPPSAASKINMSFLKTQLEAKRALLQSSHTRTLTSVAPAPVVDLSGSSKPAQKRSLLNLKARKAVAPLPLDSTGAFSIVPKAMKEDKVFLFGEITIEDEYNPTAPTDYASYKQKREVQLAKEKAAKEIADRLHQQHVEEEAKRKAGAAIAPPQALLEQDTNNDSPPAPEPKFEMPKQFPSASRGLGVAAKIMSSMGYREGAGLGRDEQGMSTALRVEKTGRTALIIGEQSRWKQDPDDDARPVKEETAQSNYDMLKESSKVVLLRNMVSRSEVDDELEAETREEMSKYGQVVNVVVHMMPNAAEDEAVRIFVEYTNTAQAIKAVVALNGRYFAGRTVKAGFYPLDVFSSKEYDR
ncbi:G-patch domain-containing protein [Aphelenchoides avenae]|nr:G-patch domain-containing protein [Aphelenchus avenae]